MGDDTLERQPSYDTVDAEITQSNNSDESKGDKNEDEHKIPKEKENNKLIDVTDKVDVDCEGIEFPTKENLRQSNIKWCESKKENDCKFEENSIFPNSLSKEEILQDRDFKNFDEDVKSKKVESLRKHSMETLVEELTEHCKDEIDICRVFYCFLTTLVVQNISLYDEDDENPEITDLNTYLSKIKNNLLSKSKFLQKLFR